MTTMQPQAKTLDERRRILQSEVQRYIGRGFRVISQTETTAQLVRPKRFSFLWAFLWLLAFGIGLIVYLFWYWSRRDETVYLQVDEQGRVSRRT